MKNTLYMIIVAVLVILILFGFSGVGHLMQQLEMEEIEINRMQQAYSEIQDAIRECEKELPRSRHCRYDIVAEPFPDPMGDEE